MSVLILPVAAIIAFFSRDIASLWLHNPKIADEVGPIASLLVIGTCLNGLMNIPFALQLAYGKTKIGLYINTFLVLFLIPAIFLSAFQYGAIGGAAMWATVNALYLMIGIPVTHKFLLTGAAGVWMKKDLLPPLFISIVSVGISRIAAPVLHSVFLSLALLALVWILTTLMAAFSASYVRDWGRLLLARIIAQR
jgi:O-antigen/teichoic acid export membrane protein